MPSPLRRSSRQHASTTAADREREHALQELSKPQLRKRKIKSNPKENIKKKPTQSPKKIEESIKAPIIKKRKVEKVDEPSIVERANEKSSPNQRLIQDQRTSVQTLKAIVIQGVEPTLTIKTAKDVQDLTKEGGHEMTVREVIAKHMRNNRLRYGYGRDIVHLADKSANLRNGVRPVTVNDTLTVLFPSRKDKSSTPETANLNESPASTSLPNSPFPSNGYDENRMWGAVCQLPKELISLSDQEFNVEGQRYVRLTSLLNEEGFTVPVTIPVKIQIPRTQGVFYMCLADAFQANYIPVKRRSLAKWVYIVLKESNLLVHKAFADLLYDYSNLFNIKLPRRSEESLEELPFVVLERCEETTIAYVNGVLSDFSNPGKTKKSVQSDQLKEYQYKPRMSFLNKGSPNDKLSVSSISDVQYLSKYIKRIEEASSEEPGTSQSFTRINDKSVVLEPNFNESSKALSLAQRVIICASFDAGIEEIQLAIKYSLPINRISEIIATYATNIRELTNILQSNKERYPGTYVGLNIMMWRFFNDCRKKGLNLNEAALKEHAGRIAFQLGLTDFTGTDAWLSAFRRRHQIDLYKMMGNPVDYIEEDEGVICHIEPLCDRPFPEGLNARCLSPNLEDARPIDIINMSLERQESLSVGNDIGESTTNGPDVLHLTGNSTELSEPREQELELALIKSLVRSNAMHCPIPELASALDKIRCFILHKDPSLLISFTELQTKLFHLAVKQD